MGWRRDDPASLGVDVPMLSRAIGDAVSRETTSARDMHGYLGAILVAAQFPTIIGPLRDSAGASGVIIYSGALIAEWGDPSALGMSFSTSKSYLSVVAGLAFDHKLFGDLEEPVSARIDDAAFAGPKSRRITWRHLLYQTSEWDGTLWDRPWWADPQGRQARTDQLGEPGTVWAYNDVRINLLALALTRLWKRPLGDVLETELLSKLGSSNTLQWHGYQNSWVATENKNIPVVSGGAHWGGGVFASAYDHAHIGALYLRRGRWGDQQLLSEAWVEATLQPCALNPDYGLLWWLNRRGKVFPRAPTTGFCARGNLGRQLLWVDPAHDLIIVSRWSDGVGLLLAEVTTAVPRNMPSC